MPKPKARYTDRWGTFYSIPNPATGEPERLANVSGLSKLLYSYTLERYKLKTVARTVAQREDLQLLAATGDEDDAVKQALDANWQKANIGTAVHSITEMIDSDTFDWEFCPPAARPFAMQYIRAKEKHGWTRIKGEYTVFNFALGYGGQTDGAFHFPRYGPVAVIGDLKTGGVYPEVAIQLGAYANAEGGWLQEGDAPGAGSYIDIPEVRKGLAVAIRLHADACDVIPVDISDIPGVLGGLSAVRRWQTRKDVLGKELHADSSNDAGIPVDNGAGGDDSVANAAPAVPAMQPAQEDGHDQTGLPDAGTGSGGPATGQRDSGIPTDTATPAVQPSVVVDLQQRIAVLPPDAKAWLAQRWPHGVPTFKRADRPHTEDELGRIEGALQACESEFRIPFPIEPDPTPEEIETAIRQIEKTVPGSTVDAELDPEATQEDRDACANALSQQSPEARRRIEDRAKEIGIPNIRGPKFRGSHAHALMNLTFEIQEQVKAEAKATKATKPKGKA